MKNDLTTYAPKAAVESATRLVNAALASGYTISVNDGEEWTVKNSRSRQEILDAMGTTGEDYLMVRTAEGAKIAQYYLIYQNGADVVSDWSYTEETKFESNRLANIAINEKLFEEA